MLLACLQGKENYQVAHKMETLIPIREQTLRCPGFGTR